jgi:hypothetical protein
MRKKRFTCLKNDYPLLILLGRNFYPSLVSINAIYALEVDDGTTRFGWGRQKISQGIFCQFKSGKVLCCALLKAKSLGNGKVLSMLFAFNVEGELIEKAKRKKVWCKRFVFLLMRLFFVKIFNPKFSLILQRIFLRSSSFF